MTTATISAATISAQTRVAAPRLRITRRGRMVLTSVFATPLVVAAIVLAVNGGMATASAGVTSNNFTYVTVESGQSLWQLAESIAPHSDPRDVIADIVLLNQLDGSVVHPGERLAIPAAYAQ